MLTCIHGTRDARECPQCVADYLNGKAVDTPTAPPAPKLCKDCRHYKGGQYDGEDRCLNPAIASVNMVRGGQLDVFCHVERNLGVKCGRSGALWEATPASARTA